MKMIIITGAGSYIGASFERWLTQWPDDYHVTTVDMLDGRWKERSFAGADAVFHVAGIAHVSADPALKDKYMTVNRDLAVETANKAKTEGVRQFVLMSSMIVYGDRAERIELNTAPAPSDFYGQSKWEADQGVRALADEAFRAAVIRCPVVYGPGCKGNFPRLLRLADITPVFPRVGNERSMIYIDNLCEFVRALIDGGQGGVFFPQNEEYVSTDGVIAAYRKLAGKPLWLVPVPRWAIRLMCGVPAMRKVLGTKAYARGMTAPGNYQTVGFAESVRRTAGR